MHLTRFLHEFAEITSLRWEDAARGRDAAGFALRAAD